MDDPNLDSRSSRRVWEDRPRGPFGVNEPLPKPVQLWTVEGQSQQNLGPGKKFSTPCELTRIQLVVHIGTQLAYFTKN